MSQAVQLTRAAAAAVAMLVCVSAFGGHLCASPQHAALPGLSYAPAASRAPRVAWLIFVDDLHINFTNTGRLKALIRAVGTELFQEGDSIGVLSANGGPSQLPGKLTGDRGVLEQRIAQVSGAALRLADMRRSANEGRNEVPYRMHMALSSVFNAIAQLQQLRDHRKAILYISNGYLFAASPDPEVGALIDEARRANVMIFAIDPRSMAGAAAPDPGVSADDWDSYLASTRDSLRSLSERTGGWAIVDETLVPELQRINRTMRR